MEISCLRHVFLRMAAALALCLVGVAACSKEQANAPASKAIKPLPDQVISDFSLTETAKSKKEWKMEAEKASIYEARNVLEAEVLKVTFFDEKGDVRSVLTAKNGKLNRNTDDMEAQGDVVVTSSDGVVLHTQSLTWLNQARQIVSEDSVTVLRHGDVLTGWGFKGDTDLGKFEILRNMRATIKPSTSETGGAGS